MAIMTKAIPWTRIAALGRRGAEAAKGVGAMAIRHPMSSGAGAAVGALTGAMAGGEDHRWSGAAAGAVGGAALGGMANRSMIRGFMGASGRNGVGAGFASMSRRVESAGKNFNWSTFK